MNGWIKGAVGIACAGILATAGMVIADAGAITVVPEQRTGHGPTGYVQPSAEILARGKYLTDMGDCVGCHKAEGGIPYAGGQYMGMPFGALSVPNITPDVDTGIGNWSDADFLKLMHHGITKGGQYIYPAMPYIWYATVSDEDTLAIKAYLFSLKPVYAPRPPSKIWFPFNLRPVLALYDAAFVPTEKFKPDPHLTAEQNHGAWIVNGLEHCGECHNNRNFLGNGALAAKVEGGPITLWYALNLHNNKVDGIGKWSDDEVAQWLHDGASEHMGTVAGPMAETIEYSLSKMSPADLHAMVAYLRTYPAEPGYTERAGIPPGTRAAGQTVYLAHCAMCHQVDGRGITNKIPALDGNGMVRAYGPQSATRVILGGLEAHGSYAMMPGVGTAMTDQEISDVTNYIRQAWSNRAPANSTRFLVYYLRGDTKTLLNGLRPDGCPPVENDTLKAALADESNGITALLQQTALPNMLQSVNAIIPKLHAAAPSLQQADIVNGLTQAYCPIAYADKSVQPDKHVWLMTHFSERLYVQLSNNGTY